MTSLDILVLKMNRDDDTFFVSLKKNHHDFVGVFLCLPEVEGLYSSSKRQKKDSLLKW